MDEQAEYAVLSKAAYDFFHGGEALARSELQEYGLGDHQIDEALSDDHAVVITRPDGSAVVSYRGTDHISDLAPDFQIALGYHHNPMLQSMGAAASQWAGDRFAGARSRFTEARNMTVSHLQGTVLEAHWLYIPQDTTAPEQSYSIQGAHLSPNPSMRPCAPQSTVATRNDNASTRPDAIPSP